MSIGIGSSTAAELKKNIRGATIGRKDASEICGFPQRYEQEMKREKTVYCAAQ